jgi:hypothetical protein
MILSIKTEYDTIFLVSHKPIEIEKILSIKEDFKRDMILWNQKKEEYFNTHHINEDLINGQIRNFSFNGNNSFSDKRFENIVEKHQTLINFYNTNTKPDFLLINRFLAIGFHKLSTSNADINVNILLESQDIKNKLKIDFNN